MSSPASTVSRQGSVLQNAPEQCLTLGQEPVRWNYPVDQADPKRLLRVDHPSGEQELDSPALADQAGKPDCGAVSRRYSQLHFGLSELGLIARDSDMAGHSQLTATSQGKAVHGRDHWLAALFEAAKDRLASGRARLAFHGGLGGQLTDIGACYEGLRSCTGDQHSAHGGVGLDPGDRVPQLRNDDGVERVQFVRPVYRDPTNAVGELEKEGRGHGSRESGVRSRGFRASKLSWIVLLATPD